MSTTKSSTKSTVPDPSATLRGVIFDHSTLLVDPSDAPLLVELRRLLERLRDFGLEIVVFSTHPKKVDHELSKRGLPPVDRFLTRGDVQARWPERKASKGSPLWIALAAESLGVETFQLMYVGDDRQDWLTAINAATFYLHAGWTGRKPAGTISYHAATPGDIVSWLTHFLLMPSRWEYALDDPDYGIYVRSLLDALVELPGCREGSIFKLQQVFGKDARDVRIGENSARDLLMLHALAGLYLEGFISPNSLFAVYPSHTPGKINESLRGFLGPVAKLFRGYFKEDLLVRAVPGKDTSLERAIARREGRDPDVSFSDQTNSVHVNPTYEKTIRTRDRTILVFDDFTTTGRSFEWARNLLQAAGAGRVVLMTVGKYPGPFWTRYSPVAEGTITPYVHKRYDEFSDFTSARVRMRRDEKVREIVGTSFEALREDMEYPL